MRYMIAVTTVSGRARDAARREELASAAADYVLAHGLSDLSLRPLAASLGTSARMLVYYFGSKEQLILDVLGEVRRRTYRDVDAHSGGDALEGLRRYWTWATSAEGRRYLRLVYEVYGLSLREPERYGLFAAAEAQEVIGVLTASSEAAGMPHDDARDLSTYTFAMLRGLELDLLGTSDVERVQRAFELFLTDIAEHLDRAGSLRS
jgi:AcrR family transcriptional regulator